VAKRTALNLFCAAAFLIVVAACGEGGANDASVSVDTGSVDSAALQPAEDVRSNVATAESQPMGSSIDINDYRAIVESPAVDSDEESPFLSVTVRIDNPSDEAIQFANIGLRCHDANEDGGPLSVPAELSPLDSTAGIPPSSFDEGLVYLLLPGEGRYDDTIPPDCKTPAFVVMDIVGPTGFSEENVGLWAIPDELVADLNAANI